MANTTFTHPNRRRRQFVGPPLPPLNPTSISLVKALVALALEVVNGEKLSVCQRRNAAVITRRIKLLLMLFEEVRDTGTLLPPSALLCFRELHVAFQGVKFLLDDCREHSSIWLLMEHEQFSNQFHELTQDMATALDILPLSLLDVSDEVREQVELVHRQARNAKLYIDPKEKQLQSDVFSVMGEFEKRATPDPEKLTWIFQSLQLNDARDCQKEVQLLEEEIENQINGQRVKHINSLISFVRYCKCVLYGVADMEEIDYLQKGAGTSDGEVEIQENEGAWLSIPDDFKCPISLDLMRDPVIVATGQTYDRASITRWIEEGHLTCPKSGMKLIHNTLIPNYALRSLIFHWCDEHDIRFGTPEKSLKSAVVSIPSTPASLEATKMTAAFLVEKLVSGTPEVQRQVVYELRLLAKCGTDNRMCIAEAGAIPYLVPLLSSEDSRMQEHAVTALLNLSIYENNKMLIMEAGALDPIIKVLRFASSMEARENAAAALFSLSHIIDYRAVIGEKVEAIDGLVQLLRDGTPRGKRDASTALFNIACYHANRPKAVKAGAVPVLVEFLSADRPGLLDDALAVLAVLAGSAEGLVAINETPAIPVLVNLLRIASPKGKENATVVLLALCRHGGDNVVLSVLKIHSAIPSLHCLLSTGTPRARRKSTSLLKILQRWDASTTRVSYHPQ